MQSLSFQLFINFKTNLGQVVGLPLHTHKIRRANNKTTVKKQDKLGLSIKREFLNPYYNKPTSTTK